jgi:DNA replication and repair protein RecF
LYLKSLELINFRNYVHQTIEPCPHFNILTGQNAQGKTNLLESIYLACTGKSFRTSREREAINWSSEFSTIQCLLETETRELKIKLQLYPGQKKFFVNENIVHGYPLGWPGVVLFTPDDLLLIKGPPQERRRFLDYELGLFQPQYSHYLSRYNRIVSQRNNLLREIREKRTKNSTLQAWNEQLGRYGAKVLLFRLQLLKKFSPHLRQLHFQLTTGHENLELRYHSSLKATNMYSEEELFNQYLEALATVQEEEIARAQTLIGPHRDDLSFFLNGVDAKTYGSQGQQRTIILALKIAQILQWKNDVNEYPVLLLDDVLQELDQIRRQALLNYVSGSVQVFLTSTSGENLKLGAGVNKILYNVVNGKITKAW